MAKDCLVILYSGGRDGSKMTVVKNPAACHCVWIEGMTSVSWFLKSGTVHIGIGATTVKDLLVVDGGPTALFTVRVTVHGPAA